MKGSGVDSVTATVTFDCEECGKQNPDVSDETDDWGVVHVECAFCGHVNDVHPIEYGGDDPDYVPGEDL